MDSLAHMVVRSENGSPRTVMFNPYPCQTATLFGFWKGSLFESRRTRKKHGEASFRPNNNRIDRHYPLSDDVCVEHGD